MASSVALLQIHVGVSMTQQRHAVSVRSLKGSSAPALMVRPDADTSCLTDYTVIVISIAPAHPSRGFDGAKACSGSVSTFKGSSVPSLVLTLWYVLPKQVCNSSIGSASTETWQQS